MSLITRCPTCKTLFKVVPDQLRISEGWVRCGQCDAIFDASLHLQPVQPIAQLTVSPPEAPVENSELLDLDLILPDAVDVMPEAGRESRFNEFLLEQEPAEPDPIEEEITPSLPEPSSDEISQGENAAILSESRLGQEKPVEPDDKASHDPVDLNGVSFLQDKNNNSFWDKPLIRATLGALGVVLLLGLAGQGVVYERDRIAAWKPSFKPWLLAMCGPLSCTLSPLRRIESIVIDSSSFIKIRGDSYRLNLTFKNTAATALAMPAIELTLTDGMDMPVVRRVFLATELGVESDTLTAGAELPASLALTFNASGTPERVAGYRLLAFYP